MQSMQAPYSESNATFGFGAYSVLTFGFGADFGAAWDTPNLVTASIVLAQYYSLAQCHLSTSSMLP